MTKTERGNQMTKTKTPTGTPLNWDVSAEDFDLIETLADRAVILAKEFGLIYPRMDAVMDLTACHANGCPLRLADLVVADAGNAGHDIFGIRRHLDRTTGKLGGFFSPRYAQRKKSRAGRAA